MHNRYFIAHIANKDLAEYHRKNVLDVAEKFDLTVSQGYFPSHITLKAPFEATDGEIPAVKQFLHEITSETRQPSFVAQGFMHFGRRIIAIDIIHSFELESLHLRLTQKLKTLSFVKWNNHESIMHLHLTIAKKSISEKFDEIWAYLKQKETPAFYCRLDNIAILRFDNNQWVIDTTCKLTP